MMPNLLFLVVFDVVLMTISGAANYDSAGMMTTLGFQ